MEKVTKNLAETKELAKEWLHSLSGPTAKLGRATIVGLVGDLGSAKTSFAQGVAEALGVTDHVTSPTFILERIYSLSVPSAKWKRLVHIDAYRLEGAEEIKHLGWKELAGDPSNLILVEWPERIFDPLPPDMRILKFEFIDENTRKISF